MKKTASTSTVYMTAIHSMIREREIRGVYPDDRFDQFWNAYKSET